MFTIEKINHPVRVEANLGCLTPNPDICRIDINQRIESLDKRLRVASESIHQLEKERVLSFRSKFMNYFR